MSYYLVRLKMFLAFQAKFQWVPLKIFFRKISYTSKNQFFFSWCYSQISQDYKFAVIVRFSLFLQKSYFFSFLKQSCLAKIFDHHLDTKWARLWSPAPSGPVHPAQNRPISKSRELELLGTGNFKGPHKIFCKKNI